MLPIVVVAFVGIACGVYLWVEHKKGNTLEMSIGNTTEEITVKHTRIVGSECQKSTVSALLRSAVGTIVGFVASDYLFKGLFVNQIFVLIGGIVGALTAKNKYTTMFKVVYSDESQDIVTVPNESSKFFDLCKYLDK